MKRRTREREVRVKSYSEVGRKPPAEPVVLRKMPWAQERLSCSRVLIYNLIAEGKIEMVRLGRAVRVTERSVLKLVDEQLKQRA